MRFFKHATRRFVHVNALSDGVSDYYAYASRIQLYTRAGNLEVAKRLLGELNDRSFEVDVYLGNLLITMFARCGSVEDARKTFESLHDRNTVTWNSIISANVEHGHYRDAMQLFEKMQLEGVASNRITLVAALKACVDSGALEEGKELHANVISHSGYSLDVAIRTGLVNLYSKCGNLREAHEIFMAIPEKNVVTWTTMAAAYSDQGNHDQALQIFRRMQLDGEKPNKITLLTAVSACTGLLDEDAGSIIHRLHITESGLDSEVAVGNALLNMYGKCGALEEARQMFDKMGGIRDLISWNVLISANTYCGQEKEAVYKFRQMQLDGVIPDKVTFSVLLNNVYGRLQDAKLVHDCITEGGFDSDTVVGNALINAYAKHYGNMEDAIGLFQKMESNRNSITWNAMIAAYVTNRYEDEALLLFRKMQLDGVSADKVTFLATSEGAANLGSELKAQEIYRCVLDSGLPKDQALGNAIVNMFGKCGCLEDAFKAFYGLPSKNVISWTALIMACVEHEYNEEAIMLFHRMQVEGIMANEITFVSILTACASSSNPTKGKLIHSCAVESGAEADAYIGNAIVSMYSKCGCWEEAVGYFKQMQQYSVVSWTVIISAYVEHGLNEEAVQLFHRMQQQGTKPNKVTFVTMLNACGGGDDDTKGKKIHELILESCLEGDTIVGNAIVNMYGKCGNLDAAYRMLKGMEERDVVSWNSMIAAYVQKGQCRESFFVFGNMLLEGVKCNEVTFVSILSASFTQTQWKIIHECVREMGYDRSDHVVANALLDMYGKLGNMGMARKIFDEMRTHDTISWNSIISAYWHHGNGREAMILFWKMQQEGTGKADSSTMMNALTACSHAGMVSRGLSYFGSLRNDYGIEASGEHWRIVIDLLGRAGCLRDAEELIDRVPNEFKGMMWMGLLGACSSIQNDDVEQGRNAAHNVLRLQPNNAAAYVAFSNVCKQHQP